MKFESTVYAFLKELERFGYDLSSIDHVWNMYFLHEKKKWYHVIVTKYRETFYINHIDGDLCSLEVAPGQSVKAAESFGSSSFEQGRYDPGAVWAPIIASARAWLKTVRKDWVSANRLVCEAYPLDRRFGIVPNALIRECLSDIYRIDKEIGPAQSRKFISLVEDSFFHKDEYTVNQTMTAGDFFNYCRIAYIAGKRDDDHVDENLSGRQMYERYADGRHEGLLDIDADSPQEFADWIDGTHPKKSGGGHPWEIKRGGNTTHINLAVYRPSLYRKEGFKVELCGASIGRLAETICMFLAIQEAGLRISIDDPEGIRRRLLAQDNIGIVPGYRSLHRANQHFGKDEHVYDVLHYAELGRHKRRIRPFIAWEPLPVLKPRGL
jgi:hypothetical protein